MTTTPSEPNPHSRRDGVPAGEEPDVRAEDLRIEEGEEGPEQGETTEPPD
jgi:hypothetical protein